LDEALTIPVTRVGPINSDVRLYPKWSKLIHDRAGLLAYAQEIYNTHPEMQKYFLDPLLNQPNQGDMSWFLSNTSFVFVPDNPEKGFFIPYVLVVPLEYDPAKLNYLMFTPNGTGELNEYHHNLFTFMQTIGWSGSAMDEIASELNMIRLHPIVSWQCMFNEQYQDATFPSILDLTSVLAEGSNQDEYKRCMSSVDNPGNPADYPRTDVTDDEFSRIIDVEKQLKLIIEDAVKLLNGYGYNVSNQVIGYGYSQSAGLISRFATVYPELFKAYFVGGTMKHILPDETLPYPYGVKDHFELFGVEFDPLAYHQIAKLSNFGHKDHIFPILDRGHNYELFIMHHGDVFDDNNVKNSVDIFVEIAEDYLELDLGGMFYTNRMAGHFVTDNDIEFITKFFWMNINSDVPLYPEKSDFEEHHIIGLVGEFN
jgi:hypothetical protein